MELIRLEKEGRDTTAWNPSSAFVPGMLLPSHDQLDRPLRWENPRFVDIGATHDLFHHDVPFEFIAAVFGVMASQPQHLFIITTRNTDRARGFFDWIETQEGGSMTHTAYAALHTLEPGLEGPFYAEHCPDPEGPWPLPNVMLATTVRTQEDVLVRVPYLVSCPAAYTVVRYAPKANNGGPIEITGWLPGIDWVVVEPEGRRHVNVTQLRELLFRCAAWNVPVYVVRLGRRPFSTEGVQVPKMGDKHGADVSEWPRDLRVQEWPVEKKA